MSVEVPASFESYSSVYHLSRYYSPDYWEEAVCNSVDVNIFFPERGSGSRGQPHHSQVKAICMECPIRVKCLQFAIDENQIHGIWGGMSYRERVQWKKLING